MQMIQIVNGQKKNDKDGLEESKELATTILIWSAMGPIAIGTECLLVMHCKYISS